MASARRGYLLSEKPSTIRVANILAKREGNLFRIGRTAKVYYVIDGLARWVPNPKTFFNLYKGWN